MKYSVLTYNFGGYDKVRKPESVSKEVEHVVVSNPKKDSSNWLKTLHVKTHPFDFTSSEWVIVMDSSIQIMQDLSPMIEYCKENGIEAMFISSPYSTTWEKEIYPNAVWKKRNPNLMKEIAWLKLNFKECRLNIESMFYILHRTELTQRLFKRIDERNKELMKTGSEPRPSQVVYSAVVANEFADEVKTGKIAFMSTYQIRGAGTMMKMFLHNSDKSVPLVKCREKVDILGMDYEPVSFAWLDKKEDKT